MNAVMIQCFSALVWPAHKIFSQPMWIYYFRTNFFSKSFKNGLSLEVAMCREGIGLHGTISQRIPVQTVKMMLRKIPQEARKQSKSVFEYCKMTVVGALKLNVELDRFPKLHELLSEECNEVLNFGFQNALKSNNCMYLCN